MVEEFNKINAFLAVVREKSLSKASAKLGISQPAVTQQLQYLEDYLGAKIVDRKKSGAVLTKEGEHFYNIALKIEKAVATAKKDLIHLMETELPFSLGASFVIGNYLLPTFLNDIKSNIKNDVTVSIGLSKDILNDLLDKKIDIALIDAPVFEDGIIYREWQEDEIVIFSNQKIPKKLKSQELLTYKWICRNKESNTRRLFKESLQNSYMPDCDNYNMISEVTSPTLLVQTVLCSSQNDVPTCSIVSKNAIKSELKAGLLFEARLPSVNMKRKLYIAYLKEKKNDPFITNIANYLLLKGN